MAKDKFAFDSTRIQKTKAILVGVDQGKIDFIESMAELSLLVQTMGAQPVGEIVAKRQTPDPKYYLGLGKADDLAKAVEQLDADLIVFNHAISPAQQRNLERLTQCHVLDRTGLILEIFAGRAQSHIGKVQVELARSRYQISRLVKAWSHLERQTGGIGLRGGPGETQLELERRMLDEKIKRLQSQLKKLQTQQNTQSHARKRYQHFTVAIVGYTNAGKSTLFNALTKAGAYTEDQLFATLDTTSRKLFIPGVGNVIISDTVGFIRDLPHQLVDAFRATLQETIEADLLLHVVDCTSPIKDDHISQVNQVLAEIGADKTPQILVMNKLDALPDILQLNLQPVRFNEQQLPDTVFVSAIKRLGLDHLRNAIAVVEASIVKEHKTWQHDTITTLDVVPE